MKKVQIVLNLSVWGGGRTWHISHEKFKWRVISQKSRKNTKETVQMEIIESCTFTQFGKQVSTHLNRILDFTH